MINRGCGFGVRHSCGIKRKKDLLNRIDMRKKFRKAVRTNKGST